MSDDWHVMPEALRRARLAQLMNIETLAKKSGVSLRSITRYENAEQRVRLDTLDCLAKALEVAVKDIARLRASGAATKSEENGAAVSALPARTQLEALVDLELARAIDPAPVKTARGAAAVLTAKRLQDVFTAYALHDGERFFLRGTIDTQRGLPPAEAKLLGAKAGVAARFHVLKEVVPGSVVGVTVHAASEAHTKALQKLQKKEAAIVVRVVVVPGEPADDVGFSSFITKVTSKRPWTFVVEECAGADGEKRGKR
jgi:transcriptional regulator with XRE-family HTH domain